MTKEVKMKASATALSEDLMAAFEAFKQENEQRLTALEKGAGIDPITEDKLARLNKRLDDLSIKAAAPNTSAAPRSEATDDAWQRYVRRGDETGLAQRDTKALNTGSDAQGGYVAPPELDRLIESRLLASSPMRAIASVRQTSAGTYRKPVSLGVGAQWVGESDARSETSVADLSLLEFPAGELYAMPAATQTLLDDAYADIDAWLAGEVDTAFSVQESAAFITGDGSNKPRGLLNYPRAADSGSRDWGQLGYVDGDFSQANAADQLIDLIHAPESAYRSNARFVMNRKTLAEVRRLKDSEGRYIWAPGQAGSASTLMGYPITEIGDLPDIGDGQAAIAFGDFQRGYLIVDRQGAQVLRDPYSAKPYVLFYTTKRVGGGVQNFDAIKLMVF